MSGIWLLLVLGLWAGFTWALWKGWRRWRGEPGRQRRTRDAAALVIGILWCGASFWYAGGQKLYYDAQVNRLCKQDGGIKVFETVKLPAQKYDEYATRNWILPDKAQAKPTDDYYYERDVTYYRKGNPEMWRSHYRIVRRSDGKILGDSVRYARRGGDVPGPWNESSFGCPDSSVQPSVEMAVFHREIKQ